MTAVALCLLAGGSRLAAQQLAVPAKTFEVASIKPVPAGVGTSDGHWSVPGTPRFNAYHLPLIWLIKLAYGVEKPSIINAPAWAETQAFDIDAKPEDGVSLTTAELQPRLQALLTERFGLVVHRETRSEPGFLLEVGTHGETMPPGEPTERLDFRRDVHPGHIEVRRCTMPFLAKQLTSLLGRPVQDVTGLSGDFSVRVLYAPDLTPASELPSLPTALKEQAGLRLVAHTVDAAVLVIDRLNRLPSAN